MSRVSNTLTMFVSGVDNHGQEGVTEPGMAWGLFYDSTRQSSYNAAMSPESLEQDAACALTAVFYVSSWSLAETCLLPLAAC